MRHWLILALLAGLLPGAPRRVVSTAPSFTETLFALDLGPTLAAVSTHCHYPAEVALLPRVGSYLKPNVEAIARLRPDLVLVHAGSSAAVAQLQAMGLETLALRNGSLPEMLESIRLLANRMGVQQKGESVIRNIEARLRRVEQKAKASGRPRTVLFVVGRTPGRLDGLVAVGKGSFLNEVMAMAGGHNVLADAPVAYPRLSLEAVHRLDPDVIVDMGDMADTTAVPAAHLRSIQTLWGTQRSLQAVRSGKVFAVAADIFVVPGPRIAETAEAFAALFQGVTR